MLFSVENWRLSLINWLIDDFHDIIRVQPNPAVHTHPSCSWNIYKVTSVTACLSIKDHAGKDQFAPLDTAVSDLVLACSIFLCESYKLTTLAFISVWEQETSRSLIKQIISFLESSIWHIWSRYSIMNTTVMVDMKLCMKSKLIKTSERSCKVFFFIFFFSSW